MAVAVPVTATLTCPREKILRLFRNIDGGVTYRCSGCEWQYTLSTAAPTGTSTNTVTAGTTTAITVASGGASFTSGMKVLYDIGANAEVVTVGPGATGTNIPVPAGFAKAHGSGATFGQLALNPSYAVADAVPAAPGWGY
jgi:hypothetical protein